MKSCQKRLDTNKAMFICGCPGPETSFFSHNQNNTAVSSTDQKRSSLNCDLGPLHVTFSPLMRCHKHDTQGIHQDKETRTQRLSSLDSNSTTMAEKLFQSSVKCKFVLQNQTFCRFLSCIRRTLFHIFCRLATSTSIRKVTFYNFFIFNFLLQMRLFSMAAASSGVWWSPGKNLKLVNSSRVCHWATQVGGPHMGMCYRQPTVITQVQKGIAMGLMACQYELSSYRWNCSDHHKTSFARVMSQDIREVGFLHALTSAAIAHQVTAGCVKGDITECGCSNRKKLRNRLLRLEAKKHNVTINEDRLREAVDQFDWGGCRDNIEYGVKKSKEFLDFRHVAGLRKRNTFSDKLRAHNEEAGRRVLSTNMKKDCRCHGLSGACTMWTCWKIMRPFKEIQLMLRIRYNMALRVVEKNDGETLMPVSKSKNKRSKKSRHVRSASSRSIAAPSRRAISHDHTTGVRKLSRRRYRPTVRRQNPSRKKLSPYDLIYFQKSPNFCKFSKRHGSLGTQGRRCEPKPGGVGSCKYLCCGRGYRTVSEILVKDCYCKFRYCCELDCESCKSNVTSHYCL